MNCPNCGQSLDGRMALHELKCCSCGFLFRYDDIIVVGSQPEKTLLPLQSFVHSEEEKLKKRLEEQARQDLEEQMRRKQEAEAEARRQREAEAEARRKREAEAEARQQLEAEAEARRNQESKESRLWYIKATNNLQETTSHSDKATPKRITAEENQPLIYGFFSVLAASYIFLWNRELLYHPGWRIALIAIILLNIPVDWFMDNGIKKGYGSWGVIRILCALCLILHAAINYSDWSFVGFLINVISLFFVPLPSFLKYLNLKKEKYGAGKHYRTYCVVSAIILLLYSLALFIGAREEVRGNYSSSLSSILTDSKESESSTNSSHSENLSRSGERPHYYHYDIVTDNSEDVYAFGPGYYQLWEDSIVEVDFYSEICQEFCSRIERDPVMAAAVFAYADKMLGTRYALYFYSEIQDAWIDGINNTANIFENNYDLWADEINGFESLLENSSVFVESVGGGNWVERLSMKSGEGRPEIVKCQTRYKDNSSLHYLCFTVTVKDSEITLTFIIETGFEPVVDKNLVF